MNFLKRAAQEAAADILYETVVKDAVGDENSGTKATPGVCIGSTPLEGNLKSVLIGINYKGSSGELRGCINDVTVMQRFLTSYGFPSDARHQRILTEEEGKAPTKSNIISSLEWLVKGAEPGDALFLHYSGHGTRVRDKDGDEQDGYDEALVPLDYEDAGMLLDDELFELLVSPLPKGCRLTAVMDCCHSGSALDLPYGFIATAANCANWRDKIPSMLTGTNWNWTNPTALVKQGVGVASQIGGMWGYNKLTRGKPREVDDGQASIQQVSEKHAEGEVIMFSGCKDSQTSADVYDTSSFKLPEDVGQEGAGGACTSAMISVLSDKPQVSFIELLDEMRKILASKKFTQVPQLSSSCDIPLDAPFYLHQK